MKSVYDILWCKRTREEIPALAKAGAVVVVPIASTEQHGLALPVDTDQQTVEFVSKGAARALDDVPVLVTPLIAYGLSPHHMVHPGTITLSLSTVVAVLGDICESIVAHGFERILILSGHGGNGNIVGAAALELRHRLGCQVLACCWWDLVMEEMDAITEGPCHTIGHAGEAEASCILFTDPESVRRERMLLVEGISDDPSIATAEKGERILQVGVKGLAKYLRQIAAMPGRRIVGVARVKEE